MTMRSDGSEVDVDTVVPKLVAGKYRNAEQA
jgi:hypothetical protein